jgi:hypothetical protein
MGMLTISGVCDHIVFKWLFLYIQKHDIRVESVEEKSEQVLIRFQYSDEAIETYQHLHELRHNAECDLQLLVED